MLPDFDTVNERLKVLIEEQDDPSGVQVVFMPVPGDRGASYTVQIAFRADHPRPKDARQFLRSASKIIRYQGRMLAIRTYWSATEKEYDTLQWVSHGALRLYAGDAVGGIERVSRRHEPASLAALKN